MIRRCLGGLVGLFCSLGFGAPAMADAPLRFDEVFSLVRSNVVGVSESDLSKAAAAGFIEKLQGKVELIEAPALAGSQELIAKTNLFEGSFAYLRVERVAAGLGAKITEAIKSTRNPKGLILDLRFTKGDDYAAAVEGLNAFLGVEAEVLKHGDETHKTKSKADVIDLPMTVLVNRHTRGAGEALAAMIKDQKIGLLIGVRTAGEALVFDEFPLSGGQRLRIARSRVALPGGRELSKDGVNPDIVLDIDEKNERRWLEDPYASIMKASAPSGPAPFLTSITNRMGRRLNSAEIARRHREELEEGGLEGSTPEPRRDPAPPVVQDAALARALDLLKGITAAPRLRGAK